MKEEELEKIKKEIKDYPIEVLISLWALVNEELKRRMEKKNDLSEK